MRTPILVTVLILILFSGCRMDHGLEPRPASWSGIEGVVNFQGEWPEDIEEVRVAVYRTYPPTDSSDFFRIAGFSESLPLDSARAAYRVALVEGVYQWVVAAGRRENLDWVEGYVFLAQRVGSPDDPDPLPVTVYRNRSTTAVDLLVDFSDLPDLPPLSKLGPLEPADFSPRRRESVP
jgi:hypothetical protein